MDMGWLLVGGAVAIVIAFIMWDNRQMTRRAEREARDPRSKPFPDLDKWKWWDSQI